MDETDIEFRSGKHHKNFTLVVELPEIKVRVILANKLGLVVIRFRNNNIKRRWKGGRKG